ncbi:MAG: CoB--CoM heterodisulfide reductase subunit C [Promethearchaeia archaeon]|nr:MAG: CoB--CoM heterodisulfide reductase subunit C [Candidatus Lokiarchaeia archaeon]
MAPYSNLIQFNTNLVDEIALDDDLAKIKACISCGQCSASCPSGSFTALRTRAVIRKALFGVHKVLEDPDIWLCSTCFNCLEHCPRTIPVTEIILKLRQMAVRQGHLIDPLKGVINNLIHKGHAVPLDSKWSQLRLKLGLDALPPTISKYPEVMKEITDILSAIRFTTRIPFR